MNKLNQNIVYLVGLHIYCKMIHGPYNIKICCDIVGFSKRPLSGFIAKTILFIFPLFSYAWYIPLITFGEEYRSRSSNLCSFLQFSITPLQSKYLFRLSDPRIPSFLPLFERRSFTPMQSDRQKTKLRAGRLRDLLIQLTTRARDCFPFCMRRCMLSDGYRQFFLWR